MTFLKKNKIIIIAEIGVNHEGSFNNAKRMIELAAVTGVNYVKFQSYTASRFIAINDFARLNRVKKFALTKEEFNELNVFAKTFNIGFLSTPITEDWVEFLNPICPAFKIASGDITFKPVIKKAAQTGKPLIISTGAATIDEIDQAVKWVQEEIGSKKLKEHLVLMHCVSAYPTPIDQANILSIPFLKERYRISVGYSNHVVGINACLAAVALGADVIEVHFTDGKEGREFRDHALSFDQHDLKIFIQAANEIKKSLGVYDKCIQPCEQDGVDLMRKGIIAAKDLKSGQILLEDDLMFARPAIEFKAEEIINIVGKKITQDIDCGYLIPKKAVKCVE